MGSVLFGAGVALLTGSTSWLAFDVLVQSLVDKRPTTIRRSTMVYLPVVGLGLIGLGLVIG